MGSPSTSLADFSKSIRWDGDAGPSGDGLLATLSSWSNKSRQKKKKPQSLLERYERWIRNSRWGPGGAAGIGCGVGIGVGVTGGVGIGAGPWNAINIVFGAGAGCGIGVGYGFGGGLGILWDRRPSSTD